MTLNRRNFVSGALGTTALSGLAMPAIAQAKPIRIGCVTSLVGAYSQFGEAHSRGMQLAADALNAQGGVNGRKFEIVVRDDGLKPDVGVATARELAADGIRIFAGVPASGVALALSGMMEQIDSIIINCAAHGNNLTHEDFHKGYFRVTDYSAMRIAAGSYLMAQRYGDARNWGSVAPDIEIGHSVMDVANVRLPEAYKKLKNVAVDMKPTNWVKFGATDYRNEIARLQSQDIDGLLIGVGGTDEATFLQQAGQLGLTSRIKGMFTSGSEFVAPIALKSRLPKNYWSGFHWYYGAYLDNPIAKQLVDAYRAKGYGQHPDGFVGMGHAAVFAVAAAMRKGAGETSKEMIPAMEGLTFDSCKGSITFRKEDHQAITDVNYVLIGGADNADGWQVLDFAKIDGAPYAGDATPGVKMKLG